MKGWAFVFLGAALAAMPLLLPAQVSLTTVVDLAQRNSSAVKLAETDLQKAQAALAQTQDAYIPKFAIGSMIGYSHGFPTGQPSVGSATMQSLVLSYSQRQYTKAARAGLDAANLSLKDAREQVALDASTTYVELDTVDRELGASRQQETLAGDLVRIEEQRTEAGVDSGLDLLQTRLKAAQLKLQRLHLETRAATLSKQLAVLTGMPVGSILPDHASIPEIPAVTADEAPRSLPGLDAAGAIARSKQLQAKGDDLSWRRPQIGFGAVYNYDSNELNSYTTYYNNFTPNNISFGLQVTFPFFDFSLRAKAKETADLAPRDPVETVAKVDVPTSTLPAANRVALVKARANRSTPGVVTTVPTAGHGKTAALANGSTARRGRTAVRASRPPWKAFWSRVPRIRRRTSTWPRSDWASQQRTLGDWRRASRSRRYARSLPRPRRPMLLQQPNFDWPSQKLEKAKVRPF